MGNFKPLENGIVGVATILGLIACGGSASAQDIRVTGSLSSFAGTVTQADVTQPFWGTSDLTVGSSGSGTLSISGAGEVTLGGITSINGGFTQSLIEVMGGKLTTQGELRVSGGSLSINNGGTVVSQGVVFLGDNGAGSATVTGGSWSLGTDLRVGFFGAGSLEIGGTGSVISNNVYIGGRTSNADSVARINAGSWNNVTNILVGSGLNQSRGTLEVGGTANVTTGGVIVGLDANTTGIFRLNGGILSTNQVSKGAGAGSVSFDGGTLRLLQNQSALFSGFAPGELTLNAGGGKIDTNGFAVATDRVFSGAGGLTKSGTGTLTLSGANSYTGTTSIEAGTLALNGGQALGDSSAVVMTGGTLLLNASETIGSLAGATGSVSLNGQTLTTGANNGTSTFGGIISGSGGLTKAGTGTFALTAANTFAGNTMVRGGVLRAEGAGAFNTPGHTLSVGVDSGDNGTFELAGGANTFGSVAVGVNSGATGALRLLGGSLSTFQISKGAGSGSLLFDGALLRATANNGNFLSGFGAGDVQIGAGGVRIDDQSFSVGVTAGIGGSGGLTKGGSGTLTLSGSNAYTGTTTVEGGVLALGGGAAISDSGAVHLAGGTLRLLSGETIGSLSGAAGTLLDLSSAGLTVGSNNATTTFSGNISGGNSFIKVGGGTMTLDGATNTTASNFIREGTLRVTSGGSFFQPRTTSQLVNIFLNIGSLTGDPATFLIDGTGTFSGGANVRVGDALGYNGLLAIDGGSFTAGNLSVGYEANGNLRVASGAVVNANTFLLGDRASGSGSATINGTLNMTGGSGIIVGLNGSGALTIGNGGLVNAPSVGLGAFSGSSGSVLLSAGGVLQTGQIGGAAGTAFTFDGGTLRITGNQSILFGSLGTLPPAITGNGGIIDTQAFAVATNAGFTGAGGLIKRGSGSLTLNGVAGNTGTTTVDAGLLILGGGDAIHDTAPIIVKGGGSVRLEASETIGSLAGLEASGLVLNGGSTLTTGGNHNTTAYLGSITGTGSLVKTGTGTLTLEGVVSHGAGTTVRGGALSIAGNGSLTHAAPIVVGSQSGDIALFVAGGSAEVTTDAFVLGAVGGSSGTLGLNGGRITVGQVLAGGGGAGVSFNGGILRLAGNQGNLFSGFGSSGITLGAGGGTLDTQGFDVAPAVPLSGTGALTKAGTGRLTLVGANTYSGGTVIQAGTLRIGTGASISGNVSNSGSLVFERTDAHIFGGDISGSGSLSKTGTGTLTLGGNSSYTGGTTIQQGTVIAGHANALGTGTVTLQGGSLRVETANLATGVITVGNGSATVTGSTAAALSSNFIEIGSNGTGTLDITNRGTVRSTTSFVAGINGTGNGAVTLDGQFSNLQVGTFAGLGFTPGTSGSITLNNASNATVAQFALVGGEGSGTLSVHGGSLFRTEQDLNIGFGAASVGALNVQSGGLVTTRGNAYSGFAGQGSASLENGSRWDITGFAEVAHASTGSLAIASGSVVNVGSSLAIGVGAAANGQVSVSGVSTSLNTGSILVGQAGQGSLSITDRSLVSASGPITIGGLAGGAGTLNISSGSILSVGGTDGLRGGAGTHSVSLSASTLRVIGSSLTSSLDMALAQQVVFDTNGFNNTLNGRLTGSSSVRKIGAGTLTLGGDNSFDGGLTVAAGNLSLTSANAVGTGTLTLLAGSTNLGGATPNISKIIFNGGILSGGSTSNVGAFEARTGSLTYDLTGAAALTKTGTGTFALSGNSSFTGGVNLQNGTLSIDSGTALGASSGVLSLEGGVLRTTGSSTTQQSVLVSVPESIVETQANLTFNGPVSGSGSFRKTGSANLTLGGENTFAGGLVLAAGSLAITHANAMGPGTLTLLAGSADLGGVTPNISKIIFDGGILSGGSTSNVGAFEARSGSLTYDLSGAAALTKTGSGTFSLGGNSSFTGGVFLQGGVLSIDSGSALGASGGLVNFEGGSLRTTAASTSLQDFFIPVTGGMIDTQADLTLAGTLTGSGLFTKSGEASLIISGESTHTGTFHLTAGTVQIGNGGTTGSLASESFTGNGIVRFNRADNVTLNNVISGRNQVIKDGPGTLTLAGVNPYAGSTSVIGGTLAISGSLTAGRTINVAGASTFEIVDGGFVRSENTRIGTTAGSNAFAVASGGTWNEFVIDVGPIGGGTGTLRIGGSAVVTTGDLNIGSASGSNGLVEMDSGRLTASQTTVGGSFLGSSGEGATGSGSLEIGGTADFSSGSLFVGSASEGSARFTGGTTNASLILVGLFGSGSMDVSGTARVLSNSLTVGLFRNGVMDVSGGSVESPQFFIGSNASGTVNISGTGEVIAGMTQMAGASGSSAALNLLGGRLTTAGFANPVGSSAIGFAGGTLRLSANQADLFSGFAPGTVSLGTGGGTIDTQGFSVSTQYNLGGSGSLTKRGSGTLTLGGANTYGGITTVSSGALLIAGSLQSPVIHIESGGTLGGSGTILGDVNVMAGGALSPGSSPGTLSTGSQTWAGGGSYIWEMSDVLAGKGMPQGWDWMSLSGALNITATTSTPFNINITSLALGNSPGQVHNFSDSTAYSWIIASASGGINGFDASAFNLVTSGFANPHTGSFGIGSDGSDIFLTYTPIPEPSSSLALMLGAMLTTLRRKRPITGK